MGKRGKIWRWGRPPVRKFDAEEANYDGHWQYGPIILDWYESHVLWYANQLRNLVNWIRFAHDCQDPQVGCSCTGSYRFPKVSES